MASKELTMFEKFDPCKLHPFYRDRKKIEVEKKHIDNKVCKDVIRILFTNCENIIIQIQFA